MSKYIVLSNPTTLSFFSNHPELCPEEVMKQSISLLEKIISASPPAQNTTRFRSSLQPPSKLEETIARDFPTCSMDIVYEQNQRFLKISRHGIIQDVLLFEYDNETNASQHVVDLFIEIVSARPHCHGLFVSQQSGISGRNNFSHEIIQDGHVVVYLHSCQYNSHILRAGFDLIDSLVARGDLIGGNDGFTQLLTEEYRRMHVNRAALKELAGSIPKRINALVDLMQLPSLESELSRSLNVYTCTYCGYCTITPGSLSKHLRNKRCSGKQVSTIPSNKKKKLNTES